MRNTIPLSATRDAAQVQVNRSFYDPLWSSAWLIAPQRFNTWPVVRSLWTPHTRALEIGPGLRPRLPITGTSFIDISRPALVRLRAAGGNAVLGEATAMPFAAASFDLVAALDIIEHVGDDDAAFAELSRVTRPGAALLLAVPLHPARWSAADAVVGHYRRYTPTLLLAKLAAHGFTVERSTSYGMRPRSSRLFGVGLWFLTHLRAHAMWCYNWFGMTFALRAQPKLELRDGMIEAADVDEVLLLCRRD
jgi:SAM-dependent methyltransferase